MQILTRIDRRLRRTNFAYMKQRAYLDMVNRIDESREPLIVYQMGKVGSSTLMKTLAKHAPNYELFQVHFLVRSWMKRVEKEFKQA